MTYNRARSLFLYTFLNLEHKPLKISYARICIGALAFGSCSDKSLVIAHIWLFKQWLLKKPRRCVQLDKEEMALTFLQQTKGETVLEQGTLTWAWNCFQTKKGWRLLQKVQPSFFEHKNWDLLSQSLALKQVLDRRKSYCETRRRCTSPIFKENKTEELCHVSQKLVALEFWT